jgi:hypothetical protein
MEQINDLSLPWSHNGENVNFRLNRPDLKTVATCNLSDISKKKRKQNNGGKDERILLSPQK